MARGKRTSVGFRNAMPIDIARTYPVTNFTNPYVPIRSISLLPIEDFRAYHPEFSSRAPRVVSGVSIQPLKVARPAKGRLRGLSPHLQFAVPGKTIICIRRKRRREVLFARRQFGGKGGRRRLTRWSEIRC